MSLIDFSYLLKLWHCNEFRQNNWLWIGNRLLNWLLYWLLNWLLYCFVLCLFVWFLFVLSTIGSCISCISYISVISVICCSIFSIRCIYILILNSSIFIYHSLILSRITLILYVCIILFFLLFLLYLFPHKKMIILRLLW